MSIPNLGRRMTLEAAIRESDGAGGYRTVWRVLGSLWAEVSQGRFVQGTAESADTVTWTMTVRGAPIGSPRRPVAGQRFREGERVFRILAVIEADRYLQCSTREEGSR